MSLKQKALAVRDLLAKTVEELKRQLAALQKELSDLDSKVKGLLNQVNIEKADYEEAAKMLNEIGALMAQADQLYAQLQQLGSQKGSLSQQLTQLQQQLAQLQQQKAQLVSRLEQIEKKYGGSAPGGGMLPGSVAQPKLTVT